MQGYPVASKGQVVGLLGGSFDPAHAGHVAITKAALTRFGLDRVWWLVSPSNPLKTRAPATLEQRLTRACDVMRHPHVKITGIEAQLGTRYTAQTIPALKHRYPGVRFVWLMGSDNLAQFHRWQDWRHIMHNVPVGVMARPGIRTAARTARASRIFKPYQLQGRESQLLGRCEAPAWCLINLPMSPESSTRIRAAQDWT